MMGYLNTHGKAECFGCGACVQVCPKDAISMWTDQEGFSYPEVDDTRCIQCNCCHQVCPAESPVTLSSPKAGFVGYNIESDVRIKSASGGAFKAIIDALDRDAIVFGAEWTTRSTVEHSWTLAENAYEKFTGSKYVQSQIGVTFSECKGFLEKGYTVLFSGTPCQIAGLRAFLEKSYDHLVCVDIVCHGVPCSKTLERYLCCKEAHAEKRITAVHFRRKIQFHQEWNSKCVETQYEDGRSTVDCPEENTYMKGFSYGLFLRPSCGECPFSRMERCSDITIGDAWGIEDMYPELDIHQGVSLLLANSEEGASIMADIKKHMVLKKAPVEALASGNARLRAPDRGHAKRELFFLTQDDSDFDKLIYRCIPKASFIKRLGQKVKCALSTSKGEQQK